MEAVCAITTLARTYESTRCYNAEDYSYEVLYVFLCVHVGDSVLGGYFIDIMFHSSKVPHQRSGRHAVITKTHPVAFGRIVTLFPRFVYMEMPSSVICARDSEIAALCVEWRKVVL